MSEVLLVISAILLTLDAVALWYQRRQLKKISKERDMYRQKYSEASQRIPRLVKLAYGDTDEPEEI